MEDSYPISDLCEALDVSRAGFYSWRQREPSERDRADADLGEQIGTLFVRSRRTYGNPRLHRALRRAGHTCGRHRVARIMRSRGIAGRVRGRRRPGTTDSDHLQPIAPNRLGQREAPVERPNEVWAADITYVPTAEGWLYLAGVLDLGSRRVVWARAWRRACRWMRSGWRYASGGPRAGCSTIRIAAASTPARRTASISPPGG